MPDLATDGGGVPTTPPPSISQLIQDRIDRTGDSVNRIASRSRYGDHQVTQKYMWSLLEGHGGYFPRKPEAIRALATGLEVTETAIVLGFAREFGLPVAMPRFASLLPAGVDDLDEDVQVAVLGLLRTLAARRAVEPAPSDDDLMADQHDVIAEDVDPRRDEREG